MDAIERRIVAFTASAHGLVHTSGPPIRLLYTSDTAP